MVSCRKGSSTGDGANSWPKSTSDTPHSARATLESCAPQSQLLLAVCLRWPRPLHE